VYCPKGPLVSTRHESCIYHHPTARAGLICRETRAAEHADAAHGEPGRSAGFARRASVGTWGAPGAGARPRRAPRGSLRPRQPINKRFPLAVRTPIIRGGRHGSALPAIALGGDHGSRAGFAASPADDPNYAADARLCANPSDPTAAFPSGGAASRPRFTASNWIRSYSKHQVSKMAAGGMTSRSALGSTISGEVEARIGGRGSAEGGGVGGGNKAKTCRA
jgi:hypothetical protein